MFNRINRKNNMTYENSPNLHSNSSSKECLHMTQTLGLFYQLDVEIMHSR